MWLNLFQANVPFLYFLKTSENLRFSDVFRRYRKGTLAWNGLRYNMWLKSNMEIVWMVDFLEPSLKKKVENMHLVTVIGAWVARFCNKWSKAYWQPCQTSKMECFAKIVNYFCKTHHLRYLTGFWICLWLTYINF